jgi:23S rRNA (uracil1939-C5)-methyltransferase
MGSKRSIPFFITSMDGLGQGVSKLSDKVTFIPKTTIGDRGEADIMAKKKGVIFARARHLQEQSALRIKPACIHFDTCPSCHYQHIGYEKELEFKKESFKRLFRKLTLPDVKIISAPERFFYRNRIQLHYSLKSKLMGMRDPQTLAIIPVPNCIIGEPEVLKEMKRLYEDNRWLYEAPPAPTEGHVEIYWINRQLKLSWNKSYADGGFTQVYERMNQKLKSVMLEFWKFPEESDLLDLFGGNGNLSNGFNYSRRLCVDIYSNSPGEEFMNQDLYDEKALSNVLHEVAKRKMTIKHLLLDPPRSGLKNLKEWVEKLRPESMAYVSCDPNTLARDLMTIEGYQIKHAFLIDFFPSTFHFESFIILNKKS